MTKNDEETNVTHTSLVPAEKGVQTYPCSATTLIRRHERQRKHTRDHAHLGKVFLGWGKGGDLVSGSNGQQEAILETKSEPFTPCVSLERKWIQDMASVPLGTWCPRYAPGVGYPSDESAAVPSPISQAAVGRCNASQTHRARLDGDYAGLPLSVKVHPNDQEQADNDDITLPISFEEDGELDLFLVDGDNLMPCSNYDNELSWHQKQHIITLHRTSSHGSITLDDMTVSSLDSYDTAFGACDLSVVVPDESRDDVEGNRVSFTHELTKLNLAYYSFVDSDYSFSSDIRDMDDLVSGLISTTTATTTTTTTTTMTTSDERTNKTTAHPEDRGCPG